MALRDVVGQDKAIAILLRTLGRDRVPSAYLFAGESGIGKKFAAINLVKAINCLAPVGSQPSLARGPEGSAESVQDLKTVDGRLTDCCDECSSCRKIDAGTHPDLIMIAPEKGEIRVGGIRAAEEALSLKPFEGRKKVVVVDDADAMNQSAANAFLKTLEEPPDESLLILVAANPDRLPATIRSRCSRVSFAPLSPLSCEKVIMSVAGRRADPRDKKETDDAGRLPVLVRLSMGRPGLAVSSDMLRERERFISLLKNMLEGHGETWADREEMERWLDMMALLMRDMVVLKVAEETLHRDGTFGEVRGDERRLLNSDMRDFVAAMSKTAELKNIAETYRRMVLLKKRLDFNLNKAITWNYVSSVVRDLRIKAEKRETSA